MTELIIVEGADDVERLLDVLKKETNIVSFDYDSHKALENLGIKHTLVEEYLSQDDENFIDNKSVELTIGWYKNEKLDDLDFEGINLGSLLEIELIEYFFEYVKRAIGIIRVVEKIKPHGITTSFLTDFVEVVGLEKNIQIRKYRSNKSQALFFDVIEIPVRIRGRIFSIKISRKKFQLLKKIIGMTVYSSFNFKPNIKKLNTKSTILLSDYNPTVYEELLKEISNSKHNVLLLNQRRPAIWNFKSFKIMKKSKCKIIELKDFANDDVKNKIKQEQKKLELRFTNLWKKQELFEQIFEINGYSFWNAIKENFSHIMTQRFLESIERFYLINEIFEKINISCILEWAHVGLEDKILVSIANKREIPNLFLQHGLYLQNEKFEKYIPILPILPTKYSKHLVWGHVLEDFILQHGIEPNYVIKIGSPRHDKFFKNKPKTNTDVILLASNGLFHNNCSGTDTNALILMETFVKKILDVIKKYPNKKLIVKLHPGKVSFDIKPLIQQLDPTIEVFQNENIMDLLQKCDAMISLNYSTVTIDAMISKIPTLVLLPEEQDFDKEIPLKEGAVLFTSDINQIESLIDDLINNKNTRDKLIIKGNTFLERYIVNQGIASKKLVEILENYD